MRKILLSGILGIGLFLTQNSLTSAEEADVTKLQNEFGNLVITEEDRGIITFSETDSSSEGELEEAVQRLMQIYKEEGLEEISKKSNPNEGISVLGTPSLCTSECDKAFRYDSVTNTSATYNEALSQLQGYYWNAAKVHWTNVAGSSIVRWKGSGTAQAIDITQTLTFPGTSVTVGWPPSFTGSSTSRTYIVPTKKDSNSHASTFSAGEASSWIYLGDAKLETSANIRDPRGYDARVTATVTIG